jgi:AraC-like DNA-binding protein
VQRPVARHNADVDDCMPDGPIAVCTFEMPAGLVFDWHTHEEHQLAWAQSGVLTVRTADAAWVLPPSRALWIPAGTRHETLSEGTATMRSGYLRPEACAVAWTECTPVHATPLLVELVGYLEDLTRPEDARDRAMAMLLDVLEPAPSVPVDVRMPAEERARRVAEALAIAPADDRTLEAWGHEVGASSRTLSRAFLSETGLTFGRWRSLLRVRAAMVALAGGAPVGNVAMLVGFESPSAFVAAFRRETGLTPAAFARGA